MFSRGDWLVPQHCRMSETLPDCYNLRIGPYLKTASLEIPAVLQCRNDNEVHVQRVLGYQTSSGDVFYEVHN